MPDIRIHRTHALGLPKARKIAWQWAEEVEEKFDMECTVIEGEFSDTVEFKRSGVNGTLVVAPDHFELNAKLGFLLGAFSKTIEGEIEKNLDALLSKGGGAAKSGARAGAAQASATAAAKTATASAAKAATASAAKAAAGPRKKG